MTNDMTLILYAVAIVVVVIINIGVYIHVKHQIDKSSSEEIKRVKEEMLQKKKGNRHE